MKGIELALRFSYITNKLRFCGPQEALSEFTEYLEKKDNQKEVEEMLKRFEGLYPYLHSIAGKHGKDFLDDDVVEAYWLGNELLDSFNDDDMKKVIEALAERGLPGSLAERLINDLPPGFVPHHDFNVMYVGVGQITASVPTTLENMDNCRTSWGEVLEVVDGTHLVVKTPTLVFDKKHLLKEETKTAVYLPVMLPDIKKGDVVALHWGFACMKLSEKQLMNLKKYSGKVLYVVNRQRK